MSKFIKNALTAALVFSIVLAIGVFAVFAESGSDAGVHTPEFGVIVYSPITAMMDYEIDVNILSLLTLTARCRITSNNSRVQCEDALAAHQERIDNIIALMCEHGIDNLHDLSTMLQALQNEGYYTPIVPFDCSGVCVVIPVWVTIDGVRLPGYMCIHCGRIFIV